jgi:hypothetical protein
MKEFKGLIEQFEENKQQYYTQENQRERNLISTTQLASTPTLEGEDAKRLLDSLQNKPTERSRKNAEKLKEHFASIEHGYLKTAKRLPRVNGIITLDRNNVDHVAWGEGYE